MSLEKLNDEIAVQTNRISAMTDVMEAEGPVKLYNILLYLQGNQLTYTNADKSKVEAVYKTVYNAWAVSGKKLANYSQTEIVVDRVQGVGQITEDPGRKPKPAWAFICYIDSGYMKLWFQTQNEARDAWNYLQENAPAG